MTCDKKYRTLSGVIKRSGDKTVFEASLSSEFPYDQGYYTEILNHGKDAVDMTRAKDGLPLLLDHHPEKLIGRVSGFHIQNRKLRGTLRFGKSALAQEVLADVQAGIRKEISIGYKILETTNASKNIVTVDKWQPVETSIVAIPADPSVGIGRSLSLNKESIMDNLNTENETPENFKQEISGATNERHRCADIIALGQGHNQVSAAQKYIDRGQSVKQFKSYIIDNMPEMKPLARSENQPDSQMQKHFSGLTFRGAILAQMKPYMQKYAQKGIDVDVGLYAEYNQEMEKRTGKPANGFYIPIVNTRAATVSTTAGNLVATNLMAGEFINLLRNSSILMGLPHRDLTGLSGNVDIPRKTGGTTAYWIDADDVALITESNLTFDKISLTPKTCGVFTKYSHKTLVQNDPGIEDIIRGDMAEALGVEIDRAGLNGTGLNVPTGILQTAGIGAYTYPLATIPNFVDLVALEGDLAASNADKGAMAYIMTPALMTALKTKTKVATDAGAGFIWEPGSEPGQGLVNGYPAFTSNNIPAGKILFGNYNDFIVGAWGAIDIMVDPYSDFTKGTVGVRAFLDIDFGVRNPASFAALIEALV